MMQTYRVKAREELIERMAQEARILGEARMLRDDQELTADLAKAIIQRMREYMQRSGRGMDACARGLGFKSGSTLSEVLSGNYAADPEPIIRKIDKWVEAQILRENAPKPAGFVTTDVAKRIIGFTKKLPIAFSSQVRRRRRPSRRGPPPEDPALHGTERPDRDPRFLRRPGHADVAKPGVRPFHRHGRRAALVRDGRESPSDQRRRMQHLRHHRRRAQRAGSHEIQNP